MSRRPPLIIRHSIPRRRRGGFALLITITLLAFLVLLLVSLASLTRVETQVAANNQDIARARQNALFALNLALGQLQKHAGPDQRVTARADAEAPTTHAWATVPVNPSEADYTTARAADKTAIDTYWSDRRNRQWAGVWKNGNATAYDADAPATYNPVPALQSWLVSGNENVGDTHKPSDIISGLTTAKTALDKILDDAGTPHRLLVKASANVTAADATSLARAVTAPEIEIRTTASPGLGGADTVVGHYAWWVGDEGVKARANLVDSYAAVPPGETAAAKLLRETARRQSAQRPAIEAMTTTGTDGLGTTYPANHADLTKVFTPVQLAYLNTAASFPTELKTRFHDLSSSSRGVLADTKHGGLKGDLTYLLGQPTQSDFLTALRAFYGDPAVAPLNTAPGDLSANPLLNPVSTILATLPTTAADGGNYTGFGIFKNTATWEQLWSFANQGSTFNAAGQATPRRQTATQHGLYPLVIQTKMFFRLRTVGGAADADGVNRTGTLSIDCLPLIVLANPYAVPLAAADYQARISGSTPQLVFGTTDMPTSPTTDFATRAYTTEPTYGGAITYILRSTGMAPGEAQIFTIDPDPAVNTTIVSDGTYDRITVVNSTDNKRVYMKNDFDPVPSLTFNTTKTIPADQTRAALRVGRSGLATVLYMDYVPADSQGYRKLIHFTSAQVLTADTEFAGGELYTFVVDPMADGIRQGGGVNSMLNQPPTTDRPAAKPGTAAVFFSHQQAPFLQVNYRAMLVMWSGNSTYSHPLEWARRFTKNGSTGFAGDNPNPWFGANLMRPPGSTTTTRWGLVNIGEGQEQTVPPASVGGANALNAGDTAFNIGFNNYLYDIPRPGRPLASLGQLQHLNTAGYIPDTSYQPASTMNSWQTNYPLANSYPHPRVPRDRLFNYVNNTTVSLGYHFDGASLWNDLLWDRFTFSTYPQTGSFDFASATDKLVNARYLPFRDRATTPWNDESKFRGDGDPANAANARLAAANLIVDGAFNINSTSVEAWKALFSSLKNVPVGTESAPAAPFPRTLAPSAGSANAATGISANSWAGFRDLPAADIQTLAEEMVMQIRKRGPFLSLSDFVNRRLIGSAGDTLKLGLSGALQAALDRAVNHTSRLAPAFNVKSSATSSTSATNPNQIAFSDLGYILPAALAGFPGYVLQGDVLSALGPTLSARSDTFTIRTYGDSANPATGDITGRAWCEAVVQRLPDYVDPVADAPTATPAANSANDTFGRRFHIVSFRWLSPDDV